jgi:tetratricopeptide (TPR) repeat protein
VPQSFNPHGILAKILFEQDRRNNIDRVIEEAESAWNILRGLPPERIYAQTPTNLGAAYLAKGDMAGGAGTAEGHAWYEKALAVLLKAREADRATEKAYDDATRAHGKPVAARLGFAAVYLDLALAYSRLGRPTEALETYREGRSLDPFSADFYNSMARTYLSIGNLEGAAVSLIEVTQVGGDPAAAMFNLRALYARIPGGADAITLQGGAPTFNMASPRMRNDLCVAWADLTQVLFEALKSGQASSLKQRAIEIYGCPAAMFHTVAAR